MDETIKINPPVLNAGIEACLKMAEMFSKDEWPANKVPRYWLQMDINPNINLIQLKVGDKHPNGFEETPFATYRFNNDGTYTKYVNA